jgi:iron complex transport system permease protein
MFYLIPVPLILLSLFIGPSDIISSGDIVRWAGQKAGFISDPKADADLMVEAIVLNVRLPRILLTFLVGSALTMSGSALQALFRNPLVSPDILGLSAGAAFGAALALAANSLPLQPTAFIFGLIAVGTSYFIARSKRSVSTVSLILSGIIVSGIFTAGLTIIQFLTDPFRLQTIVHWTMGNLHNAGWPKITSSFIPIIAGCGWLLVMRWRMNVIALGDDEAKAVGLNPEKEKVLILLPATLIATASVAVAGIIGMVGLAVPHMIRIVAGPDNRKIQPASFVFGGSFLLIVDNFARTVASFEIPIGIFTTLIGGPFFIYLLKKSRMIYPGD